ncbi:helix-turn-helix domain-containing protein [Brachybacterium tyrofermentans]|uniref:helix-turn-helix domain-containing protein n=1 Tax=Brachybacterium tyrofermentans TaxID=47848 RepID=UPI003FD1B108
MTTTTTAPERVLRVTEVAAHLDCGRNAVYDLIHRGELRNVRVGRLIRVPESALAEFLAGSAEA